MQSLKKTLKRMICGPNKIVPINTKPTKKIAHKKKTPTKKIAHKKKTPTKKIAHKKKTPMKKKVHKKKKLTKKIVYKRKPKKKTQENGKISTCQLEKKLLKEEFNRLKTQINNQTKYLEKVVKNN
jgi:hypothetical protein